MVDYTLLVFPVVPGTAQTASGSTDFATDNIMCIAADINIAAVTGTNPSVTFFVERQGADDVWYAVWTSTAQTAAGQVSASIGPGLTTAVLVGATARLRWDITGTDPAFTFSASIIGK